MRLGGRSRLSRRRGAGRSVARRVRRLPIGESAAVVGDLRRARRKQRVAAIHWVDALYQVYITGLVAIVAVVLASGAVGDGEVGARHARRRPGPRRRRRSASSPPLAVFLGLRSGSRGGPLALEQPDVRHVLLSPGRPGRRPARPGLAPAPLPVLRRRPPSAPPPASSPCAASPATRAEWMARRRALRRHVVGLGFGSALVAAGTGLRSWLATVVGGALVAWSVADVARTRRPPRPAPSSAASPLWPLRTRPARRSSACVVAARAGRCRHAAGGGHLAGGGRAPHRPGRPAPLRRDPAGPAHRAGAAPPAGPGAAPLAAVDPGRCGRRPRFPVWQRGLRSVARWPASRLVRVLVLAAVAGLAMRGVWSGTTPLVLLAGLALWIAALDAAEPLGQEIDHPGRTDAFPMRPRRAVPRSTCRWSPSCRSPPGCSPGVVAVVPVGDARSRPASPCSSVPSAGLLAGCGAVVSVVQGAPEAVDTLAMIDPRDRRHPAPCSAPRWPPGLAVLGTAAAARRPCRRAGRLRPAARAGGAQRDRSRCSPSPCSSAAGSGSATPSTGWIKDAAEQMSPTKAHRAPGRRARGRRGRARPRPLAESPPPVAEGRTPTTATERRATRPKPKAAAPPGTEAQAQARRPRPRVPGRHQRQAHRAEEGPDR